MPAVEGEVGFLGIDKVIFAVVGDDGQLVLFFQQSGDVHPEGGEAAVVVGNLGAVQADLGAVAHTLELQPNLLGSGVKSGGRKAGFIGAAAAPVVVAAILTVDVVPGMGQVDRDGFAIRPVNCQFFISVVVLRIASLRSVFSSAVYCTEERSFLQWVCEKWYF